MKSTKERNICLQVQDLLDAHLDDAVSAEEKLFVEAHLLSCSECQNEWQFAQQVTQTLRKLPVEPCPQPVSEAVLAAAQNERATVWQRLVSQWTNRKLKISWQPIFATAAIALLLVFATMTLNRNAPAPQQISQQELERVELDIKWTLAYLGNLSKKTGLSVRDQVIEPEVVAPIQRALKTVIGKEAEK